VGRALCSGKSNSCELGSNEGLRVPKKSKFQKRQSRSPRPAPALTRTQPGGCRV